MSVVLIDTVMLGLGLLVGIVFLVRTLATDKDRVRLLDEVGAVVHVLERIAVVMETKVRLDDERLR